MKVTITPKKEKSQAEFDIAVPAEMFKPFVEQAAKKLSSDHAIKGFRPGKAPMNVVIDHVGQERLLREAMDRALPHFFVRAAVDHDVEAINRPSITIKEVGIDKSFRFSAIVDVLPEVRLGDPKRLKVEKHRVEVKNEQVEQELKYLAKMRSTYLDVTRPAQPEDVVTVDFEVRIDGQIIEGGQSKNHRVTIGDSHFVPDFEKGITGIQAGDQRRFTMKFPDDYPKEKLRGQPADVSVKAHSVQKRVIPQLNDEFAKGLGKFRDLTDLKQKLKANISQELEQKEHDRYLGEMAEKFAELTTFGYIPDILTEKEIDNRLSEFTQMLIVQQKTLDDYLRQGNKTLQQMRDDMRPAAEKNVKIGLTLRQFAQEHKIKVGQEEIEEEATKQLRQYKTVAQASEKIDTEQLREHITSALRNRKTLEKLAELTKK